MEYDEMTKEECRVWLEENGHSKILNALDNDETTTLCDYQDWVEHYDDDLFRLLVENPDIAIALAKAS